MSDAYLGLDQQYEFEVMVQAGFRVEEGEEGEGEDEGGDGEGEGHGEGGAYGEGESSEPARPMIYSYTPADGK
jgi:hypothetical protein